MIQGNIEANLLSKQKIEELLSDKGIQSPVHIQVVQETESTNLSLKRAASEGAPHLTFLFAETQTKGRGRLSRNFFSPSGVGLYFSCVLRTKMPAEKAVAVTSAVSVAVSRAIDKVCSCESKIKWVNDIYLNGKKICGILADGALACDGKSFEYIIIGIGINVNTPQECFDEELQVKAGSIYSITGRITDRNILATELISQISQIEETVANSSYLDEYRERSCVIGKKVYAFGNGMDGIEVTVDSIDDNGFLHVTDNNGNRLLLNSGEITLRNNDFR